jgi:hypothetical protein
MERADLAGQCSPLSSNALGITIPLALLSTADEVIEWPDFPVEWMSARGTFETCRLTLRMSANRG